MRIVIVALALVCGGPRWALAQQHTPVAPEDVAMELLVATPRVLPLQPIRLRLVLRNASDHTLRRLLPIDSFVLRGIWAPDGSKISPVANPVEPFDVDSAFHSRTSLRNGTVPLQLAPGERVTVSFTVGPNWADPSAPRAPLFSKPGRYDYSVHWYSQIIAAAKIDVAEPEGEDKFVGEFLQDNPKLAACVVSGVLPPDKDASRTLAYLLKRYPKSSYAPFMRLALARVHLQGTGISNARRITTEDWNAAYQILDDLKNVDFAYQPNVWAMLYRCSQKVRPQATDGIRIGMAGGFSDADVILEELAEQLIPENWLNFRVRDGVLDPVPDEPGLPRALIVGDNVSVGYTHWLRRRLKGKANVHRIPESAGSTGEALAKPLQAKDGPPNPGAAKHADKLDQWLGEKKWDVIVFNFGLDDLRRTAGRPRTTVEQYEKNLRTIAAQLKATGATVIWASTTPVPDGAPVAYRAADVAVYNAAATKIAEEFGFAVVDLHTVVAEKLKESKPGDLFRVNDIQPTLDGGRFMGELIAKEVEKRLAERR